ncbi:MAG: pullulanase [Ignavibacteria bacterium]|nr:pullulanase [Ignavibacteria bacterium]
MKLLSATLQSINRVVLVFERHPGALTDEDFTFAPHVRVLAFEALETIVVLLTEDFDLTKSHTIFVRGDGSLPVLPDDVFDTMQSSKPLGCVVEQGFRAFRLFAPRAVSVELVLFADLDDTIGTVYDMSRDADGVWEMSLSVDARDRWYAYRIDGPRGEGELFSSSMLVADPYGQAVATRNTWRHEARTLLPGAWSAYDWGDDRPVRIHPRDLVIYEMHVKDMTAHPSSGVEAGFAGTYPGLVRRGCRGGIDHIARLGVNAVELLPCQHFAAIELPYLQRTETGLYNTWNPYERNHWGYMTSYFFAPEPSYATAANATPGEWNDTAGRQVREFKDMVRAFHATGIAVIMDVVYNHTSHYDQQPLKAIDKFYYYRTDGQGDFTGASGCGNDLDTAHPMTRRLVVDSVLHWMREYHVDGFRFDLAAMIDVETLREVCARARELNPDVILIGEPWGGGQYDLRRFSELGMGAWNDQFRNGVKGVHPSHAQGYVFGSWAWNSHEAFGMWVLGSVEAKGGPLLDAAHSVNYLASHDGYTLGDFIRIATGAVGEHQIVEDGMANARLGPAQLRAERLAALMLLTSQGSAMLHAGQEFGRSKVIADRGLHGTTPGLLDHNSYEKDDETNWLDFRHADINGNLVNYTRGLIAVRALLRPLRHASVEAYRFLSADADLASGFVIDEKIEGVPLIAVLVNANPHSSARYHLPEAAWDVLVDAEHASVSPLSTFTGSEITVEAGTGCVLLGRR